MADEFHNRFNYVVQEEDFTIRVSLCPFSLQLPLQLKMKKEKKYRKEYRHTSSVADELHNKFHYVVQEEYFTKHFSFCAFFLTPSSSRQKDHFRNRVTDRTTLTVSLLCSTQPKKNP